MVATRITPLQYLLKVAECVGRTVKSHTHWGHGWNPTSSPRRCMALSGWINLLVASAKSAFSGGRKAKRGYIRLPSLRVYCGYSR